MKIRLLIFVSAFATSSFAQIPKSGTYTYNYCDEEYNACLSKCKVKIKGNKIWVYAPAGLTGIKKGALYESGTLYKNASGKWVIINNKKEKSTAANANTDQLIWIDFKRKNCWTF
jgi:uncharacterized protein YraI